VTSGLSRAGIVSGKRCDLRESVVFKVSCSRMKSALAILVLALPASIYPAFVLQEPESVSIIRLIANPDAYDGKFVRIIGFVRFEFEGNAIYVHEEDYKQGLRKNGLWLSMEERKELDRKYALIEGVFNAKDRGHFGLWSGSIGKVTRAMLWPSTQAQDN
jgi:hypothetical protein